MKKLISKISFILLIASCFTACGPVYKKFYSYEPMRTESQRTCAVSCQMLKQSCFNNQQQTYQLCLTNAKLEYQSCKSSEMWGYSDKGKWECQYNCYCYEPSCSEPDRDLCEDEYANCYTGCGGKVEQTVRCVENCDQIRQPPAQPRSTSPEVY